MSLSLFLFLLSFLLFKLKKKAVCFTPSYSSSYSSSSCLHYPFLLTLQTQQTTDHFTSKQTIFFYHESISHLPHALLSSPCKSSHHSTPSWSRKSVRKLDYWGIFCVCNGCVVRDKRQQGTSGGKPSQAKPQAEPASSCLTHRRPDALLWLWTESIPTI